MLMISLESSYRCVLGIALVYGGEDPLQMPSLLYRTIYILCPAKVRTGGPEALHQLGRALLDLGHDARMVYIQTDDDIPHTGNVRIVPALETPMPPEYRRYEVPQTLEIVDDASNSIVFSELWPGVIRKFNHLMPHLWWLSIDNGLAAVKQFGGFAALAAVRCVHLSQSYYGLEYLAERRITALAMFDYTSPDHTEGTLHRSGRDNRILYPVRGQWFTHWLRRWAPDLNWQEISGFTPAQVHTLFRTSKLYVDFGKHPGKDRMPREAAIHGCCVITGLRGSAGNALDIPIQNRYKFDDSRLKVPQIIHTIRDTLAEYDERVEAFATYRQIIMGEAAEFIAQVARAFGGQIVAARATAAPAMAPLGLS